MELHDDSEFDPNHICSPEPESTIPHIKYCPMAVVPCGHGTLTSEDSVKAMDAQGIKYIVPQF